MRVTIEDLEALKELNDELEENHVETERSLHEEIGITAVREGRGIVLTTNPRIKGYPRSRTRREGRVSRRVLPRLGTHHRSIPRARHATPNVQSILYPPYSQSLTFTFLVSELDTLRAETQNANEKSASAATQTAAMLSLNLKLQSTASKNHAKQIELEVKTIEAREIKELLTIIQVTLSIHRNGVGALLSLVAAIPPRCVHRE